MSEIHKNYAMRLKVIDIQLTLSSNHFVPGPKLRLTFQRPFYPSEPFYLALDQPFGLDYDEFSLDGPRRASFLKVLLIPMRLSNDTYAYYAGDDQAVLDELARVFKPNPVSDLTRSENLWSSA